MTATPLTRNLALAVGLALFTLPEVEPVFGIGVDHSLTWAFNHLFAYNRQALNGLSFPHGPLAFLMYPLNMGQNLWWGLAFTAGLMVFLHFALLQIGSHIHPNRMWKNLGIALIMGMLVNVNTALMMAVAASLVAHFIRRENVWLIAAGLLAALALNVRAGTGIIAAALVITYAIIALAEGRNWRVAALSVTTFFAGIIGFRLIVFGTLAGTFDYFVSLKELSGASSAATAYYPTNNWWLLTPGIFILISSLMWVNDARTRWVMVLFIPALFAAWKHGTTRQDLMHYRGLVYFLGLVFGVLMLVWEKPGRWRPVLLASAIALFALNTKNVVGYEPHSISIWRQSGIWPWVFDGMALTNSAQRQIDRALRPVQLLQSEIELVTDGTVDVYPWELTLVAANNLQWQPRPVVQSYAAYTPWLDSRDMAHFYSAMAPKHVLFHPILDGQGGELASLDGRYLLNDEPNAIMAIIDRYTYRGNLGPYAHFARTDGQLHLAGPTLVGAQSVSLNEWVEVPTVPDGILRAKIDLKSTVWGKLVDFVYKGPEYSIEYRLADGRELRYRLVPENARDGVWVNPFVTQIGNTTTEPLATHLRINCSEPSWVKPELSVVWQSVALLASVPSDSVPYSKAFALFGKTRTYQHAMVFESANTMETPAVAPWHGAPEQLVNDHALSGNKACQVPPGGYSHTFIYTSESEFGPVNIAAKAAVWGKAHQVGLVISVQHPNGQVTWEAQAPPENFAPKVWNILSINRKIELEKNAEVRVYVMNSGTEIQWVDDITVKAISTE